jgi:hypothetical protein
VALNRKLRHGPLPRCPICQTELEYGTVVRYGTSFLCTNCQTELRIPKSYSLIGFCISVAASVALALTIGLRGWSLILGVALLVFPTIALTDFARRHRRAPKLTVASETLKLR